MCLFLLLGYGRYRLGCAGKGVWGGELVLKEADMELDRSLKRYFSSSRIPISRTANTRLESSRM